MGLGVCAGSPNSGDAGNLGEGYPWPDLQLEFGHGYVQATLRPVERSVEGIRFLSATDVLLSPRAVEQELRRFVEDTIQQLDDAGIVGTPLQEEWTAVVSADPEVVAFCKTASGFGLDPYDLDDAQKDLVLSLGSAAAHPDLIAELAANTRFSEVETARVWLREAVAQVDSAASASDFALPCDPLPAGRWEPPWRVGYERARAVRERLGLNPAAPLPVDDLVAIGSIASQAPSGVRGLAQSRANGLAVVTLGNAPHQAQRFAAARAIGRQTFAPSHHGSILTARDDYGAKVERSFAAELLAPAAGIAQVIDDPVSDDSLLAAAAEFDVSIRVIQHQLDNQLGGAVL